MALHGTLPHERDPSGAKRTEQRIAPVGSVYAGATGAAAQASAAAAAAAKAASQVAYGGTKDGAVIYDNLCAGCHKSGAGGSPPLVAAQGGAHLPKGKDPQGAHLHLAKLDGADLSETSLVQTTFGEADLSGAKLLGARIQDTTLAGAKLSRADFTGATLDANGGVLMR